MTDNQQFYQDFTSTYIDAANDFGFTAVDANELAQQTTQVTQNATTQVVSGVSDTIKTEIFALNTKINEILTKISALQAPNLSILPQKTDIARLEEKIDKTLAAELRELSASVGESEQNIRSIIDEVEERKEQLQQIFKNRMIEIEKLVLPLLYNLMKNPDKEYILWPNRTDALNKQIAKIISVTKSELSFD
jgi:DNA repair exonuclease SbcCD ATPase subunit